MFYCSIWSNVTASLWSSALIHQIICRSVRSIAKPADACILTSNYILSHKMIASRMVNDFKAQQFRPFFSPKIFLTIQRPHWAFCGQPAVWLCRAGCKWVRFINNGTYITCAHSFKIVLFVLGDFTYSVVRFFFCHLIQWTPSMPVRLANKSSVKLIYRFLNAFIGDRFIQKIEPFVVFSSFLFILLLRLLFSFVDVE